MEQQEDWLESYKQSKTGVVMDYYNKKIMAPMVRVSTYPMRMLALDYGCDIAYSEELIDLKLMKCTKVVNEKLKTIDFIAKDNTLCYRTSEKDKNNVVQLGTASAVTALEAANVVVNDVCAIDINMGCPKHFSIQGGMGSALLSQPEKIKDILGTLKRNLNVPITCKIRLLSSDQSTIDLLRVIEQCGVSAIGVHCRTIPERPKDSAHWDRLESILKNASFNVPIIANGDIFEYKDIDAVKKQTNANSVMIARGAIRNVSIFSRPLVTDLKQIIQEYIEYAYKTENSPINTKFVINSMLNENLLTTKPETKQMSNARDFQTFTKIWDINEKYNEFLKLNPSFIEIDEESNKKNNNNNNNNKNNNTKKTKLDDINTNTNTNQDGADFNKKQKLNDEIKKEDENNK